MRLHRPVLAGIALGAALLPVTAANAATGVTAAGSAVSTATLVHVSVGSLAGVVEGTTVSLGTLAATAQTLTDADPAVTFVPITLNGVKTGAVTVTPANSPKTVGGVSTGSVGGLLSATSPAATLTASDGSAATSSLTSSLGSASVLGLPVTLDGGVEAGSSTDAAKSMAAKGLTLSDVSLPNLADLLAALGIDIAKLPVDTLNGLIDGLHIAISSATQTAMDAANTAIDTAEANLADGQQAVTDATSDVTDAKTALEDALSGATLPPEISGPLDAAGWDALTDVEKAAVDALNAEDLTALGTAYDDARDALDTAQGAIAGLEAALATATGTLSGLVEGVLDGTPLVSVGAAEVGTKALAGSSKSAAVTGFVSGVEVLGTDILADVTGDTEIDVAALAGDVADQVNAALATATAALSSVLSEVTGATGLVVPAPVIEVMKKTTKTGTDGAFGTAMAQVTALSVSLGSATIPTEFALADAGDLPGLAPIADGFQTAPLSVKVGTLSETARFRPGGAPATPGNTGSLPSTGAPAGLAVIAVIGTALAVGTRRFRGRTAE